MNEWLRHTPLKVTKELSLEWYKRYDGAFRVSLDVPCFDCMQYTLDESEVRSLIGALQAALMHLDDPAPERPASQESGGA